MHPSTSQAMENIDAAIFSGDLLYVPFDVHGLKLYLARWNRAVAEHEASEATADAKAPSKTKHTPSTKLGAINISGNLYDVARYVNQFGLSDFVLQAECSGNNSLVLFKLPVDWPTDHLGPLKATET